MAELSQDQLHQLCEALGWQGGTFWQALETVRQQRASLERIAKPGYGLELNDPIEEREHYWQQALLRCRETARAALNAGAKERLDAQA